VARTWNEVSDDEERTDGTAQAVEHHHHLPLTMSMDIHTIVMRDQHQEMDALLEDIDSA
jgi:hypothetical protein